MCESNFVKRIVVSPVDAKEVIKQAKNIYVRKCPCRISTHECSPDLWEVCFLFDAAPKEDLRESRKITQQDAQKILDFSHRNGFIHNLFFQSKTDEIVELCNCCTCCCSPLRHLKQKRNFNEQIRTGFLAITQKEKCIGCGECVKSCFFEARDFINNDVLINKEKCFGCGRCISFCPTNAIRLKFDSEHGISLPCSHSNINYEKIEYSAKS